MSNPVNPAPDYDLGAGLRKSFPVRYAESGAERRGLERFPIFYVDGKPQTRDRFSLAMTTAAACGLLVALVVILG